MQYQGHVFAKDTTWGLLLPFQETMSSFTNNKWATCMLGVNQTKLYFSALENGIVFLQLTGKDFHKFNTRPIPTLHSYLFVSWITIPKVNFSLVWSCPGAKLNQVLFIYIFKAVSGKKTLESVYLLRLTHKTYYSIY